MQAIPPPRQLRALVVLLAPHQLPLLLRLLFTPQQLPQACAQITNILLHLLLLLLLPLRLVLLLATQQLPQPCAQLAGVLAEVLLLLLLAVAVAAAAAPSI
jgi:hypothetical protein